MIAYRTKDGDELTMVMTSPREDPRGWRVQDMEAKIGEMVVGHLRFAFIPEDVWQNTYPTLLHYVLRCRGKTPGPKGERAEMLNILGFGPHATIKIRELKKIFEDRYLDEFRRFEDYHRNKPQVESIRAEILRKGIGIALYEAVARELATRGLSLWSSTSKQKEAVAVWEAMKARGYPVAVRTSPYHNRTTLTY